MARTILVVEDSPTQAERVRLLLEDAGYTVWLARDGQEGLKRVREALPDLIVSDVVMPRMDGYAFCQAVKAAKSTRRIPFVLLTDRRSPLDILKGLERGVDNFITKPYEDAYLLERVGRILEHVALREQGHLDVEVVIQASGRQLVINADKQQIIELLFSTSEELCRVNEQLRDSRRAVEEHVRALEAKSRELEDVNAQLQRASEAKSRFLASMSHELRTPLNAIIGFTELLLSTGRDPLTDRQRAGLGRVAESGHHLLALINDILDLSKIEAGRLDVRPEAVELGPLIETCLAAVEPQAQAKGLSIGRTGCGDAPTLVQDPRRLKQILLNLLSNALKFTPAGSVDLQVQYDADGSVAIAVADTGVGIAPEHIESIFDPFHQVDSRETRAAGGTGLGLTISRRLAGLMGGRLDVESTPGRGSVFTLRLPVRYRAAAGVSEGESPGETPPGVARVLVVDDDRDVVEIVREALADEPYRVEWAASVTAAMGRLHTRRPAVVMLDVLFRGHDDGWDALRALKDDPATRDIPVLVYSIVDNRPLAERLGADAFLLKPADLGAVRATLSRLVAGPAVGAAEGA